MSPLAPLSELETRIKQTDSARSSEPSVHQGLFASQYKIVTSGKMISHESPVIPSPIRRRPYLLGRDSKESKRLSDQHEVLLKAAGGYIPVPLYVQFESIEAILDVGTGNAQWLLGLRQSGMVPPSVELCGVDVSDKMMPDSELGRNFRLNLEVRDLCEPLPVTWNQKFDYIHGRHVLIWIEPHKWPKILINLKQALKPGGTLLIIYPGDVPYDCKTNEPLDFDTAPRKLFSAFLEYTASTGLPRHAVTALPDLLREAGFDPKSIVSETKRVNLGRAEPDVGLRPASARHLDFVLELINKLNPGHKLGGPTSEDWVQLIDDWRAAADEGFYYNLHILAARRPLD